MAVVGEMTLMPESSDIVVGYAGTAACTSARVPLVAVTGTDRFLNLELLIL
jgi:hypothetical protein